MAGRFNNTQILNPNAAPIPQIMADPRIQSGANNVFVADDAALPNDYFDVNPFNPINKEYPVRNVAPLSDKVAGNIKEVVFGGGQEDKSTKDILIQAMKNEIVRKKEAKEKIKSINQKDGRELRQGKIPEEKSMTFDVGDSLKHYFDVEPFNPDRWKQAKKETPKVESKKSFVRKKETAKPHYRDLDEGDLALIHDPDAVKYLSDYKAPAANVEQAVATASPNESVSGVKALALSPELSTPKTDVSSGVGTGQDGVFKAKAKKSVRDWTDNSDMQYIAQVNPYAAAGMGFANQMANPFKQKYFENRADANEEEDARRLNYEIARQKRLDDIAEQERKANALQFVDSESFNVPFMSEPSSFMSADDLNKYNSAMNVLGSSKEYDISTVDGKREFNKDRQLRKAARATINQLNLKYRGKGSVIKSSSQEDPLNGTGKGDLFEELEARHNLPAHQRRNLEFENAVNKGNVLGRFGTFLNEVTSFGASDRRAKMFSNLQRIHNKLAKQGYVGHVISRETLDEEAAKNPQIAARQNEIEALLDQRNTILVQMVSRNGHNVITYLVTPDGIQDLNDVKGLSARSVGLGTEENAMADVRDDLRY